MGSTKRLGLAFVVMASLAFTLGSSASATGPEMRTVTIALSPENAAVAVDGHPRQHPSGTLELRGPLGSVFTVEAVANGGTIVERVAVTNVGALPARLVVPPAPPPVSGLPAPLAIDFDECTQRTWRDTDGVKHYKAHCLFDDALTTPPRATGTGALSVVCLPKCDHVFDNGNDLGAGNVFNRPVPAGMHVLSLTAPNGVKKTLVIDVPADQTKVVRVSMDANPPADSLSAPVGGAAPPPPDGEESGYLTIASYPWAKVSEGNRTLCLTPCIKIPLAPGLHVLELENESASVKQTVSVTMRSGEVVVKRLAFK